MRFGLKLAGTGLLLSLAISAAPASAAPIITAVGTDVTAMPFSFSYLGSTFTFSNGGSFPDFLAVSTAGSAAVRTVFGTPSTDFTNRGTVVYDQNILGGYGSFPTATTIPVSNGNNFLGLRVTSAGQSFYGFLYSTNTGINSYGFESAANTAIRATTDISAAVPEPGSWALMIVGFGGIGFSMRRRKMTLPLPDVSLG